MKLYLKMSVFAAAATVAMMILTPMSTGSAIAQPATMSPPSSSPLSEATIKSLQEALNKQGIAVKADGILTDETRSAIRKYQSQHHLPVTSEPDRATLEKLGVTVTGAASAGQTAQAPTTPGMDQRMGRQMMQGRPQGMMGPGMMSGQMPAAGAMPMQQGMMMCPMMAGMNGQQSGMTERMMGQGRGAMGLGVVTPSRNVLVDDVRDHFERLLQAQGNPRVKLGEIKDADKETIVAEIVTTEGSLVDRFSVNRRSGAIQRAQ